MSTKSYFEVLTGKKFEPQPLTNNVVKPNTNNSQNKKKSNNNMRHISHTKKIQDKVILETKIVCIPQEVQRTVQIKYVEPTEFGKLSFKQALLNPKPVKTRTEIIKTVEYKYVTEELPKSSPKILNQEIIEETDNNWNDDAMIKSPIVFYLKDLQTTQDFSPDINEEEIRTTLKQHSEKYDVETSIPIFKRVLSEIKEINKQFHNLRTVIHPDPEGQVNIFYFLTLPNDGAFCHLPLFGRFIIPKGYPSVPPVFHMLTKTNRYNVDVFHYNAISNQQHASSMCFDVLNPSYNVWQPDYTLSTVFGSLIQAVVSYLVPQLYGGPDKAEFVTMESLKSSYDNVIETLNTYKNYLPKIPLIPAIRSRECYSEPIKFPREIKFENSGEMFEAFETVGTFNLQSHTTYSVGFDLSELTDNYVLSFIITNNPRDLTGKKKETILFRNGVTATAARKIPAYNETLWYYHGKPLNQGNLKLAVTISHDAITLSYKDMTTNNKWYIHGDTSLSSLDKEIVGDISDEQFYFVLYCKRKWGTNSINIKNLNLTTGFVY
jgi:ubiquitin-protein ligase